MTLKPMTLARLKVVRLTDFGAFLDGGTGETSDDVLLHKHQQTRDVRVGEHVNVLLYLDPKRRLVASMRVPKIDVGEIAQVKIINASNDGMFVDVGAERGIFMPFAEMIGRPKVGDLVRVKLYNDKSERLAASMKGAAFHSDRNDNQKEQNILRDAERVVKFMNKTGGFISERLPPAFIQQNFHISKAAFKRALGHLFKQRLIERSGDGFKFTNRETNDHE